MARMRPTYRLTAPATSVYVGDCRDVMAALPAESVDLIFADPPFNWNVRYAAWDDSLPREDYLQFTRQWLDGCIRLLAPHGSLWVNIPDDTAAEIVMHLKGRGLEMVNWCVWHFRFGQCRKTNFIVSKVHALYFVKDRKRRTWNPDAVLELSDRAAVCLPTDQGGPGPRSGPRFGFRRGQACEPVGVMMRAMNRPASRWARANFSPVLNGDSLRLFRWRGSGSPTATAD